MKSKYANMLIVSSAKKKLIIYNAAVMKALSYAITMHRLQEASSLLQSAVLYRRWKLNVRQGRYIDATYRTLCMWPNNKYNKEREALEVLLLNGKQIANIRYRGVFRFISTAMGERYLMDNIAWGQGDTYGLNFRLPHDDAWRWSMPYRAPKSLASILQEEMT